MKFYKIDLLTLLISLFLFASCNKSSDIGLALDPEDAIEGVLNDQLMVRTQTVPEETINTYLSSASSNPSRMPFGWMTDPVFGTTEVSLAMSVNLPSGNYSFGSNAVVDSAVLVLPLSTGFYGDTTTSVYSMNVQQLATNLSQQNSFKSDKEWAHQAAISGNFTGKIKPNTPISVTDVVSGGADTTRITKAAVRIKLDKSFIQKNIVEMSPSQLNNNVTFNEAFKGLHVAVKKESTTGAGGLMFFDFTSAGGSQIEIYYKKQSASSPTAIDTVKVDFPINQSTGPVAATIKHNYTGTPIEAQLKNNTQQFDVTYLQPLAGVRTKISFPDLKDFAKNVGGKVVINKAELVVELSASTDVFPFTPAGRLALYQYDLAGQRAMVQDQTTTDYRYTGNFGTGYNASAKQYTFILTGYVQDLIDGKTQDMGTYLAPVASALTEYSIAPSITSAERSIIGSSSNTKNKVKLNIYYTKY